MDYVIHVVEVGSLKNETARALEDELGLPPEDSRKLVAGTHAWVGDRATADRLMEHLTPVTAKIVLGRSYHVRGEHESVVPVTALAEYVLGLPWSTHAADVEAAADVAIQQMNSGIVGLWRSPESVLKRAEVEYEQDLAQLEEAKSSLMSALGRHGATSADFANLDPGMQRTVGKWVSEAKSIANLAAARRVPFLQSSKLDVRLTLVRDARPVLAAYEPTRLHLLERHDASIAEIHKKFFEAWIKETRTSIESGTIQFDTSATDHIEEPKSFIPRWLGGHGSPADRSLPYVYLGHHYLAGHKIAAKLVSSDRKSTNTTTIDVPHSAAGFGYPLVTDLDATGGFVTDQRGIVESSVLQLLDSIEPGMLRIDGVDPVGLGKSLDFLYGLNDAGDKVLGDAIWTTAEQVAKLLVNVEKHVTFVTQKYLQGQHTTLTEYNVAAGEVAEPYRLVLLYDFPRMFTRDGKNYDQEALTRFHRLASVGRRAGVFFFVVAPNAIKSHQALDVLPKIYSTSSFGAPPVSQPTGLIESVSLTWRLEPAAAPSGEVRNEVFASVLRGIASHSEKRVLPRTVAELAERQDVLADKRGLATSSGVARSEDVFSWWARTSSTSLESRFGRMGSSGLASLQFNSKMESSALIGGQTGSGKSSLFHAVIMDLVLNYSPDELQLYLVDLKEGVEFKQYAESRLPHARAVAVESSREFAVSVLSELELEIQRRGTMFKALGGSVVDLTGYRIATGQLVPRIVLMIDEFHKLFDVEDSVKREAERLLERVIKEGRAFGIHVVLGSQTIALVGAAFRSLADQIYYRLVLSSSESDSRLLLGEANPDAQLLTRPGEGILNTKSGLREGNSRFQTTFWDATERQELLGQIRIYADSKGWSDRTPVIFEGSEPQRVESLAPSEFGTSHPNDELSILMGSPMSLEGPYRIKLDRAPGRNLLIVDDQGRDTLITVAVDLAAAGIEYNLIDFGAFDAASEPLKDALAKVSMVDSHRAFDRTLEYLLGMLDERFHVKDYSAPAQVLLLAGLQRARDMTNDQYAAADYPATTKLQRLLSEGPEFGIHVIALADRPASVERRLTPGMVREFGIKIIGTMAVDDSRRLVDTDNGASLKSSEIYFDDYDRVISKTLRRFEVRDADWIVSTVAASRALS